VIGQTEVARRQSSRFGAPSDAQCYGRSMRPLLLVIAFGVLGAGIAGVLTHGADQHAFSLGAIAGVLVGLLVDLAFHIVERQPVGSARAG
jgi:hypothetical protein